MRIQSARKVTTANKEDVLSIVGNSILNGIDVKSLSKKRYIVKVHPHLGATTEDLIGYIKPVARRIYGRPLYRCKRNKDAGQITRY